MAYFPAFFFGFFAANRSVFLRRAARFLILSLPRLCPIYRQINVLNQSGKSRMMRRPVRDRVSTNFKSSN